MLLKLIPKDRINNEEAFVHVENRFVIPVKKLMGKYVVNKRKGKHDKRSQTTDLHSLSNTWGLFY